MVDLDGEAIHVSIVATMPAVTVAFAAVVSIANSTMISVVAEYPLHIKFNGKRFFQFSLPPGTPLLSCTLTRQRTTKD